MTDVQGLIKGLHHITNVTANQEMNRRFYTEILGLRRVKLTVNQDDFYHRHLFYADEKGTTGSAITFFEWPELQPGQVGLASPHHLSYRVPSLESLWKWKSWLLLNRLSPVGPLLRDGGLSLYLRDPDGLMIELIAVTREELSSDYLEEQNRDLPSMKEITHEMRLTSFDHASPITMDKSVPATFFEKVLGLQNHSERPNPDQAGGRIVAIGNGDHPDFMSYLVNPRAGEGYVGRGSVHHIAMAVEGQEEQRKVKQRLDEIGIRNSGVIDRLWFKSLYFRDPEGNLLEVATKGPGYTTDEPAESLGSKLALPPWLEEKRGSIEVALRKLDQNNAAKWPPSYPPISQAPERVV